MSELVGAYKANKSVLEDIIAKYELLDEAYQKQIAELEEALVEKMSQVIRSLGAGPN